MSETELFFDEEEKQIASLESQLMDVVETLEALERQDGVARRNMVSFESQLPEELPLASFTKNPTHTNLEAAKVALENYQGILLGALAAVISTLIARLVNWFFDKLKARRRSKSSEKIIKSFNEYQKADSAEKTDIRKKPENSPLERRFQDLYTAYGEECSNLGPFVRQVFSLQRLILDDYIPKLVSIGEHYSKFAEGRHTPMAILSEMQTAQQYLDSLGSRLQNELKGEFAPKGKSDEKGILEEVVGNFYQKRNELSNQPPLRSLEFTDWVDRATNSSSTDSYVKIPTELEGSYRYASRKVQLNMKGLEAVSKSLGRKRKIETTEPLVMTTLQEVLKRLQSEIRAVYRYIALLDDMETVEADLFELASDHILAVLKEHRG